MKDNTVKLSGHAKDRFIERFFAEDEGLDAATRQRLVSRSQSVFTSLRVRKAALTQRPVIGKQRSLAKPRRIEQEAHGAGTAAEPPRGEEPASASVPAPQPAPVSVAPSGPPSAPVSGAATSATAEDAAAFDPYVFGLVPVFQREGAEGLLAKLGGIATADRLRAMAKAQQVVLPQQLRSGDVAPDEIRAGIVEAVAKRIKDRRAAAG